MQNNTMQHKFGIYYKCGIKALNTFALCNGAYNNNNNDRLTAFDPGQPG